jgi:hypothetical protein
MLIPAPCQDSKQQVSGRHTLTPSWQVGRHSWWHQQGTRSTLHDHGWLAGWLLLVLEIKAGMLHQRVVRLYSILRVFLIWQPMLLHPCDCFNFGVFILPQPPNIGHANHPRARLWRCASSRCTTCALSDSQSKKRLLP